MRRIVLPAVVSILLCFGLYACAAKIPAEGAAVQREVAFLDSFSFDRKLSASLAARQPEVDVVFPAAITLNNIPERMDKWLSKVEKFGGKVEIEPEPDDSRSIIAEIIGLFVKAYEAIEDAVIYSPAKGYDVTIRYKAATGLVTRMRFGLRGVRQPQGAPAAPVAPAPAGEEQPEPGAVAPTRAAPLK